MNRHARTRIRNRFVHPVLGLFEALWMLIKDISKAFQDGFKTLLENDLYRP